MTHKTFAIHTLGCKVNQEEAAAIAAAFLEAGYREVPFSSAADIYIVNTCTVTSLADRKSRAMIRRAKKTNPGALVIAAGCYAQVSPDEVKAIVGVDLILGVDERAELLQLMAKEENAIKNGPEIRISDVLKKHDFVPLPMANERQRRARAFLKIQDGCDQFCHYCIIPYARGASRSLPQAEVLKRAQKTDRVGASGNSIKRHPYRRLRQGPQRWGDSQFFDQKDTGTPRSGQVAPGFFRNSAYRQRAYYYACRE